ncbi:MAG: hypothetical protein AVDCRST_MAG76-2151, partial [uncultured Acidimicrobiales bacterium]
GLRRRRLPRDPRGAGCVLGLAGPPGQAPQPRPATM